MLPRRYFLSELRVIWLPLTCPHTCGIGLGNQDILSYQAMLWRSSAKLCARLLAEAWLCQEKLMLLLLGLPKDGGKRRRGQLLPSL